MAKGKAWDLTSANSLDAAAEWLRKQAGAVMVLVVRGEDVACALDRSVAPKDALGMVDAAMPEMVDKLERQRVDARCQANILKVRTER